jgi:hypothetical protein
MCLFFLLLAFSAENTTFSSVGTVISFILSYYIYILYNSIYFQLCWSWSGNIYFKTKDLGFVFFFAAYLFGVFKGVLPADDQHMSKHHVIKWVCDKMKIIVVPIEESLVFWIGTYQRIFLLHVLINSLTIISWLWLKYLSSLRHNSCVLSSPSA